MALLIWVVVLAGHRRNATVTGNPTASLELETTSAPVDVTSSKSPPPPSPAIQMVELSPTQVLAAVNGRELKLADIVPTTSRDSKVTLDKATWDYYLKRAVDRELIFETAKTKGISLDNSQYEQIAKKQSMKNQPEPGGIAKLNDTPEARQLEMQDDMAFMLQTTLMAQQGDSPDVSESQALAYYQQHQSEFDVLPADPAERELAWARLDAQIRKQLEPSVRAAYNSQLADFMQGLEARANVFTANRY